MDTFHVVLLRNSITAVNVRSHYPNMARRASTLAIFSDRRSRDYNSAKSLTRGSTTPLRCRVQSTIISSTARVCALAARYMHLNLISGAKGKDGIGSGEGGSTGDTLCHHNPNRSLAAATTAQSWLQLLQLSAHVIRAHYAKPRLSMPAVTSRFPLTVRIHPLLLDRSHRSFD